MVFNFRDKQQSISIRFLIILTLEILTFSAAQAQTTKGNNSMSSAPAFVQEAAWQMLNKKITEDFFNLTKASLIVANGPLSEEVNAMILKSKAECNSMFAKEDIKNTQKSFDLMNSGQSPEMILMSASPIAKNCLSLSIENLNKVSKPIIIPGKSLEDLKGVLGDPRVLQQLNKLDPNNIFIKINARKIYAETKPVVSRRGYFATSDYVKPITPPGGNANIQPKNSQSNLKIIPQQDLSKPKLNDKIASKKVAPYKIFLFILFIIGIVIYYIKFEK